MTGCPCGKEHQPTRPKPPFDDFSRLVAPDQFSPIGADGQVWGRGIRRTRGAAEGAQGRVVHMGDQHFRPLFIHDWEAWPANSPMNVLATMSTSLEDHPGALAADAVAGRHQDLVLSRSPDAYYRGPRGLRWTFGRPRQGARFPIGQHTMVDAADIRECVLRAIVSIERHHGTEHQAVLLFTDRGVAQPWWAEFVSQPGLLGCEMRMTWGTGSVPQGLTVRGI